MVRPPMSRIAQQADARYAMSDVAPDAKALRTAMSSFPTGVAVLGCGIGADTQLMTANSVLSVSLDPMLILVSVQESARIGTAIAQAGGYAVSFLSQEQRHLCDLFSRRDRPIGLEAADVIGGGGGGKHAVVSRSLAAIECSMVRADLTGDHVLYLGAVETIRLGTPNAAPLVFHRGGYPRLDRS